MLVKYLVLLLATALICAYVAYMAVLVAKFDSKLAITIMTPLVGVAVYALTKLVDFTL